ncbi:MAG: 2-succinyl-6-hydroxy-2,4-cyclohexadiene-carboxylate synthase [Thermoleophilaceae bacterium]|nr:2-succinyl-6-hydroxy-2,4-cyclohexadiene-carboxylate synthase [Thermoleophilaceae bacterium]
MQAPLVVFIPGFMQPGEAWAPVARRVAERYPTLCLEFETHTLEGRLDEIAAAAPAGSVLAGYSMGGRLALWAAVRDTGRFASLVLVGSTAGIEVADQRRARLAADLELAERIETQPIEATVREWERQPVFAGQSAELVEAQRPGRLAQRPADLAELLRSAGQGALEPVWDRVASLPMPLLAIAGERDARYVAAAERLAALAPLGRAAKVPAAGHAAHLERPGLVAELVLEALDGGN